MTSVFLCTIHSASYVRPIPGAGGISIRMADWACGEIRLCGFCGDGAGPVLQSGWLVWPGDGTVFQQVCPKKAV